MFSSARLFAFVFFFLFFFCLWCILISRLIFTTFSSGNMLSFFFYVIIYCWSYLFTFIFHAESVGVYVHFDFLCWYLAFFDQLIIIVLCSFDSKQIPRNKKKCCSQSFFLNIFIFGCRTLVRVWGVENAAREGGEDCSPNQSFSSVRRHFNDFLTYQKVASFPFKWSPEQSRLNTIIYL